MQSNYRRQVNLQTLYNPCLSLTNISPLIGMQSNCHCRLITNFIFVSLRQGYIPFDKDGTVVTLHPNFIYSLPKPYKYSPLIVMQSNYKGDISPLIGMQSNCRCQVNLQNLYSLPKPTNISPLGMQSNYRRQVNLQTLYSPCLSIYLLQISPP